VQQCGVVQVERDGHSRADLRFVLLLLVLWLVVPGVDDPFLLVTLCVCVW
jgi:hypothetical protein